MGEKQGEPAPPPGGEIFPELRSPPAPEHFQQLPVVFIMFSSHFHHVMKENEGRWTPSLTIRSRL